MTSPLEAAVARLEQEVELLRRELAALAALVPDRALLDTYRLPAGDECLHADQRIVARACSDGSGQHRYLCPTCWRSGRAIPGRLIPRPDLLPAVSSAAVDAGRRAFDQAQRMVRGYGN